MKVTVTYHVILKVDRTEEADDLSEAATLAQPENQHDKLKELVSIRRGCGLNDYQVTVDSVIRQDEPRLY